MKNLLPSERQVLDFALSGNGHEFDILRAQYSALKVINREFTGAGFFTEFSIPEDTQRLNEFRNLKIGDVVGSLSGVRNGVGFIIFIDDGAVHMLEGYTYDEEWPQEVKDLKLQYLTKGERNFRSLAAD